MIEHALVAPYHTDTHTAHRFIWLFTCVFYFVMGNIYPNNVNGMESANSYISGAHYFNYSHSINWKTIMYTYAEHEFAIHSHISIFLYYLFIYSIKLWNNLALKGFQSKITSHYQSQYLSISFDTIHRLWDFFLSFFVGFDEYNEHLTSPL